MSIATKSVAKFVDCMKSRIKVLVSIGKDRGDFRTLNECMSQFSVSSFAKIFRIPSVLCIGFLVFTTSMANAQTQAVVSLSTSTPSVEEGSSASFTITRAGVDLTSELVVGYEIEDVGDKTSLDVAGLTATIEANQNSVVVPDQNRCNNKSDVYSRNNHLKNTISNGLSICELSPWVSNRTRCYGD